MERLPSSDTHCIFKYHNWSSSFFWIFFCPLFQTHLYSFSNQNLLPLWRLFGSPSSGFFFFCVPLAIFSYKLHCDYVCTAPSSPICGDIVGMGSVTPYPPLRLLHYENVFTDRHDNNFTSQFDELMRIPMRLCSHHLFFLLFVSFLVKLLFYLSRI